MAYPSSDGVDAALPSEPEDAGGVAESDWESDIAIPRKEDRQPRESVSWETPEPTADADSPRQADEELAGGESTPDAEWRPLEQADDLPDTDPVDLPAFIDTRKRGRD